MKNFALTFVVILVFSSSIFAVVAPGDNKTASHAVNISIDNLALLSIKSSGSSTDISLNPTPPTEAGAKLDFSKVNNSDLWLNYSSIVGGAKNTRNITANIEGTLPGGTSISVAPTNATSGNGKRGTAVTSLSLTTTAANLVEGIGSCYTESGASKGVNLSYKLNMDESKYEDLYNNSYNVKVIYTITDVN